MGMNNHGGKGSASRPLGVPLDEYAEKFDGIFGAKKRTNGGWTPPPLPKDTNSTEVKGPSGATMTMTMPKARPAKDGEYKFGIESNFEFTDNPSTTEDGMVKG